MAHRAVIEETFMFGEDGRLVGTLSRPDPASTSTRPDPASFGLVLFSAGVISRTGHHRLNVRLARRFAREGIPVLRFDLTGQGDSRPSNSTIGFEQQSILDVRSAMDEMSRRTGLGRFVHFGICSGAALSYSVALEDSRVVGCLLLDPYMYPTFKTRVNRVRASIREHGFLRFASNWARGRARALLASLGPRKAGGGFDPMGGLGVKTPPQGEFADGLSRLLDRGVELLMIYSAGSYWSYNYADQFDDGFRRYGLAGRVQVDFMPEIDHTVTTLAAQGQLTEHLFDWVERRFGARAS